LIMIVEYQFTLSINKNELNKYKDDLIVLKDSFPHLSAYGLYFKYYLDTECQSLLKIFQNEENDVEPFETLNKLYSIFEVDANAMLEYKTDAIQNFNQDSINFFNTLSAKSLDEKNEKIEDKITVFIKDWSNLINSRNYQKLEMMYASNVNSYGKTITGKEASMITQNITKLNPKWYQDIDNITLEKLTNTKYILHFDRAVREFEHSPTIRSYMILKVDTSKSSYKIISEAIKPGEYYYITTNDGYKTHEIHTIKGKLSEPKKKVFILQYHNPIFLVDTGIENFVPVEAKDTLLIDTNNIISNAYSTSEQDVEIKGIFQINSDNRVLEMHDIQSIRLIQYTS